MLAPSWKKLKRGRLRKSQSIRRRIVNMGNILEVDHLQPQVVDQARIRTTTMEVESSTGNDEIELLSKDLLHHMMDFFVSESGLVDGSSLRSCAMVCKRWKEVAYSPSIWSIPASLAKLELEQNSSMATAPTTGQGPPCSLASSLAIREMVETDAADEFEAPPLPVESLIGFYNLGRINTPPTSPVSSSSSKKTKNGAKACISFRVMERATGRSFILSLAKDDHNTPEVIKELFQAHLVQSQDFFSLAQQPRDNISERRPHGFPRGVHLRRDGRLIRCYDDNSDSEIDSECHSEDQSSGLSQPLQPLDEALSELSFSICHLLSLEGSSEGPLDQTRGHLRSDCWAPLVDWIAEIVECFDLSDLTAFRAMGFFDRFFSQSKQRVKQSHYQLIAGACLYIACKCEDNSISSSDISFSADNSFNGKQIVAAENMILSQLGWKLAVPVVLDFVLAYSKVLGLPENHVVVWMMRYIAELGLQTQIYLSYRPSMIAASSVVLSCFCLPTEGVALWPASLESESGYAWHMLEDCTLALCRAIEDVRTTMPDLSMVFRRYRKPSRANVAGFAVPSIQSFTTLTSYRERHVTA